MYNKLNITENHLQALSLFTNGFEREYYIREVGKLLRISPRTAQLILEDLEEKGIVESKTRGKIKLYALRINEMSRSYLTLAEEYKTTAFLERNLLVREIVEKISPFIKGIGAIFGSYAKGTANKESDLDVFIAGSCNKEEIKKVSRKYGLEISVKCYPAETFKKNIAADLLLREILKNHLIFLNAGQFVRAALKNG